MSQDAINASAQNAVVAINSLNALITSISDSLVILATNSAAPAFDYGTVNTPVYTGAGQNNPYDGTGIINKLSVLQAGTTQGYIYDSANTGATISSAVAAIPTTIGVYSINIRFGLGIVVEAGTDQSVIVTYTPD